MQLVEQHRIDRHDPRWKAIDAATFASKNLYNSALYVMRQQFIANHYIFPYAELDQLVSPLEQYQALPRKVAQWVLKQVCAAWTSYQAACAEYAMNPQKFKGHPKLPKYLDKQGRNLLVYTEQAISRDPKNVDGSCRPACRFGWPPSSPMTKSRKSGWFPKPTISSSKSSTTVRWPRRMEIPTASRVSTLG